MADPILSNGLLSPEDMSSLASEVSQLLDAPQLGDSVPLLVTSLPPLMPAASTITPTPGRAEAILTGQSTVQTPLSGGTLAPPHVPHISLSPATDGGATTAASGFPAVPAESHGRLLSVGLDQGAGGASQVPTQSAQLYHLVSPLIPLASDPSLGSHQLPFPSHSASSVAEPSGLEEVHERVAAALRREAHAPSGSLVLSCMPLRVMPVGIASFRDHLRSLVVMATGLTAIHPVVAELANLRDLTVAANHITTVPAELARLVNLERLSLFSNKIDHLPEELFVGMTRLQELDLFSNRLVALPRSVGCLTALRKLSVYDNQLTRLPMTIGNLSQLRLLAYKGNPLQVPEPRVLRQGTRTIINYCRGWSPQFHAWFPQRTRQQIFCVLLLAARSAKNGRARYPRCFFCRLPKPVLFYIIHLVATYWDTIATHGVPRLPQTAQAVTSV